jgi:hypothetical protein
MKKIKTLTNKQYLKAKGRKCPNCHSTEIEGQEVNVEAGTAFQEMGCNECNASWMDTYVLTGYTNLGVSEEDEEDEEEAEED